MQIAPVTIAYIPPRKLPYSRPFAENITRWKTTHPLVLFSDPGVELADTIKMRAPVDMAPCNHKYARSNFVFLTALRILRTLNPTHFLYVEADSRVSGDHWDKAIFDEFEQGGVCDVAGSVMCYAPCNKSRVFCQRWNTLIEQHNKRRNFPLPTYGMGGQSKRADPCLTVNGSLGIYNYELMRDIFHSSHTVMQANMIGPWDFYLGLQLYKRHKDNVFDHVKLLCSVFSSYGDNFSTEEERRELLSSGAVRAVHQIKSSWAPA